MGYDQTWEFPKFFFLLFDTFPCSDLFSNEPNGKILLIDPNIRRNVGDNLITYGELVFLDSLGYKDYKECGIAAMGEFALCDFSHFNDENVDMGIWQGGGNWGNLYNQNKRQTRRLESLVKIAKRGKKVLEIGRAHV